MDNQRNNKRGEGRKNRRSYFCSLPPPVTLDEYIYRAHLKYQFQVERSVKHQAAGNVRLAANSWQLAGCYAMTCEEEARARKEEEYCRSLLEGEIDKRKVRTRTSYSKKKKRA